MHILIVDDESCTLEMMCETAARLGYSADCLSSAVEAMPRLKDADLVLMDWELPGMSGLDFIKAARENGYKKPMIMVTIKETSQETEQAMRAGADDLIWKPCSVNELEYRINKVLEQKR